jgi:hypothetical protein
MANSLEITGLITKVDMNILPYLKQRLIDSKYSLIEGAMYDNGLQDSIKGLSHYVGKREDDSVIHYLQIDFTDHESLYVVVEQDELRGDYERQVQEVSRA